MRALALLFKIGPIQWSLIKSGCKFLLFALIFDSLCLHFGWFYQSMIALGFKCAWFHNRYRFFASLIIESILWFQVLLSSRLKYFVAEQSKVFLFGNKEDITFTNTYNRTVRYFSICQDFINKNLLVRPNYYFFIGFSFCDFKFTAANEYYTCQLISLFDKYLLFRDSQLFTYAAKLEHFFIVSAFEHKLTQECSFRLEIAHRHSPAKVPVE